MIRYSDIHISYDRILIEKDNITLYPGTLTLIHGNSGIGKSALLYRFALITEDCKVESDDIDLHDKNKVRREDIAFVMQGNDLVGYLTTEENLREAARIGGTEATDETIQAVMNTVSLDVPLDQSSSLLSLGERQRLCIACALIRNPKMIILDEPTASLDKANKIMVFELLKKLSELGHYVIFTSHEEEAKEYADVIFRIENRHLVTEKNEIHIRSFQKKPSQFHLLTTLREHIRCFSRLNIWQMVLLTSFIVLITVLNGSAGVFTSVLLESSRQELYEGTDKYLYITDSSNSGYLETDTPCTELPEGYPVYKIRILEDDIYVIPYFDEMHFNGKVDRRYSYEKAGMYVSHGAWETYGSHVQFRSGMGLQLLIPEKGIVLYNGTFLGKLKQGVRSYLLENNDMYISIYYKELEKMCLGLMPCGVILFYTEIEELENDRLRYLQEGYTVNAESARYDHIIAASKMQEEGYSRISRALLLLGILMIAGANIVSLRKRAYELALLKSQGIGAAGIALMLGMETLPALVLSAGITLLAVAAVYIGGLGEHISALLISLGYTAGYLAGLFVFNYAVIHLMSCEKVFRD